MHTLPVHQLQTTNGGGAADDIVEGYNTGHSIGEWIGERTGEFIGIVAWMIGSFGD